MNRTGVLLEPLPKLVEAHLLRREVLVSDIRNVHPALCALLQRLIVAAKIEIELNANIEIST